MLKASQLSLNRLLDISQKSEMSIADHPMTIMSIDAWGGLRKDLISTLGIERAKRLLIRYGWNNGKNEAKLLKKSVRWADNYEWLIAGSKMHHLTGRVFSYPETFNVDMEQGTFDVEGYWIDSYEAKEHLKYFQHHHEPVCYFLIGYAGGYTSECMGKTIIFKEMGCKGSKDDHCSYKAKTLEQWGEEIEEELFYYKDIDTSDELDLMYRRVEQQKNKLKIGNTLSNNLTEAMLEGEKMTTFAEIISKSVHCPVVIENNQFDLLAKYGEMPGMKEEITARSVHNQIDEILEGSRRISIDLKDKTYRLLTVPIIFRKQVNGFITMAVNNLNDDFHFDLLERAASITALFIQNERIEMETKERLKGELADELLNNSEESVKDELINRFRTLGYDLSNPHYVFHIEIDNEIMEYSDFSEKRKDYYKIKEKLLFLLKRDMDMNGKYTLLINSKTNYIQLIASEELIKNKRMTAKVYGEKILSRLGKQMYSIYIGVSDATEKVDEFSKQAREAKKAVDLAKKRTKESTVILSRELGHLSLFLNASEPEELKAFAKSKLGPLMEYDKNRSTSFLQTLYSYAENGFNLHKTARTTHVSISGMKYRIQKIEELLGLNLSDSNCRFELQLSLQILLALDKMSIV